MRCTSKRLSNTAALGLGRRSTTAGFQYRLRSLDVFTVLYSSVLVSAAVSESSRKSAQLRELDDAVGVARADLKALEDRQQRRPNTLSENQRIKAAILSCDLYEIRRLAARGRCTWSHIFEWESQAVQARNALCLKDWKGIHLEELKELSASQIEDALLNDPLLRRILRGPKTSQENSSLSWKQVRILEWSMVKLTCTLLRYTRYSAKDMPDQLDILQDRSDRSDKSLCGSADPLKLVEQIKETSAHVDRRLTETIDEATFRAIELRGYPPESSFDFERYKTPQAPRYNCISDHEETTLLNSSLASTFRAIRDGDYDLDSAIDKVCLIILTSSAPPNTSTYALLIKNLTILGRPGLVKYVVNSLNECHFTPTSELLAVMLDSWSSIRNRESFKILMARMQGYRNGLAIAHPKTIITPATLGQYRFSTGLKKGEENYINSGTDPRGDSVPQDASRASVKIYRKAEMSQEVYRALVQGSLLLFGYRRAMINYINMISKGYEPTVELLLTILQYCCRRRYWEDGFLVWQKIQSTKPGAGYSEYYWILQLCRVCGEIHVFRSLLKEGTQLGFFPSLAPCFPEQWKKMNLDVLIQSATEHIELRHRLKNRSTAIEPVRRLWEHLAVICYEIICIARQFGEIELLVGQPPLEGHYLTDEMKNGRREIVTYVYALRKENVAHESLDLREKYDES